MSLDIWLKMDVDTGGPERHTVVLHDANITHNLTPMWELAGCYEALYESEGKKAGTILPALEEGLRRMCATPLAFQRLNPPNGWGDYDGALRFLTELTEACREHPKAKIRVSA